MEFFLIYAIGYVLSIIMVFIDNRVGDDPKIDFQEALVISMFSWATVIVFISLIINLKCKNTKLNKWFRGE